ncbi:uncharacterized protein K452DRAFT_138947 [Aplosporella prunicola CBS 121167]|uniref:Uncharacterized protein n=1 Tax=Aplosporella prunicola CBS 121167 TaxID=1176127 RepID=A0A6A6AZQ8_9PEZI|nr:uncharacterized protein K452DRAFT_138947 [Aplosporella prunicola CBS 121167]KAF2136257.1 hypothetical protein K452DRAFT_138947 [Aplosporella prunicola CBS 121167]
MFICATCPSCYRAYSSCPPRDLLINSTATAQVLVIRTSHAFRCKMAQTRRAKIARPIKIPPPSLYTFDSLRPDIRKDRLRLKAGCNIYKKLYSRRMPHLPFQDQSANSLTRCTLKTKQNQIYVWVVHMRDCRGKGQAGKVSSHLQRHSVMAS